MKASKQVLTPNMVAERRKPPTPEQQVAATPASSQADKTEIVNFRVPSEFRHQLRQMAVDHRMNLSQLFMAAIKSFGASRPK